MSNSASTLGYRVGDTVYVSRDMPREVLVTTAGDKRCPQLGVRYTVMCIRPNVDSDSGFAVTVKSPDGRRYQNFDGWWFEVRRVV